MAETIEITPGEVLEILERSEEVLVFQATYARGGSPPPSHFHPVQAEHFEILAGTLHVEVEVSVKNSPPATSSTFRRTRATVCGIPPARLCKRGGRRGRQGGLRS